MAVKETEYGKSLAKAMQISKEKALADIDLLPCEQEEKERMRAIAAE